MAEDRPRIFNRGANVEVLRLRIVCRNEEETGRVLIINAWGIHKAAGAGRLKRFGQLPNLKWPEISRQRHEVMLLHEADHLSLAALVRF